jgi:hypothetical protein
MTILEIRGPGSREGADSSLTRGVDTEGARAFCARDGAREDDRATVIQ